MRKLFIGLLALLLSVGGALWVHQQGGFVVLNFGRWTLQTSPVLFLGAIVATLVALYLVTLLLRELFGVPRRVRHWAGRRRERRARTHLVKGLLRIAEGRYDEAEKLLLKDVRRSDEPLLHYLAAAVIEQHKGSFEGRDRYLALADRAGSQATLAVGLMQAQLQTEAKQWEQALATLNYLYDKAPHNVRLLRMLMKVCRALQEWERLEKLLPQLRKQGVVDAQEAAQLERQIATHRLEAAAREGHGALLQVWERLNKDLRDDAELALIYADGLALHGQAEEAERQLRTRIPRDWNPRLVHRYGALEGVAADRTATQLEKWLKERPEDPALLYAAGRQALRAELWGRARSLLEAAVARSPRPEVYHTLGALMDRMGEAESAHDCYRKALELLAGPALPPSLPATIPAAR